MLTFISCAKTMASHCSLKVPEVTVPYFEAEAVRNALEMSQVSAAELEKLLKVNAKIAAENRARFHDFCSEDNRPMPAIGAYTGAVFKRILPKDFTADDFRYAQEHLRITSFLYGLLRPLDGIRPYRLEGDVRLPEKGGITMFDYWKPLLTDYFIEEIKKHSRNYAKRQYTWFNNQFDVHWYDVNLEDFDSTIHQVLKDIEEWYEKR